MNGIAVRLAQERQPVLGSFAAAGAQMVLIAERETVGVAASADEMAGLTVEDRAIVGDLGDEAAILPVQTTRQVEVD
jgi:hypothetical protein